MDDRERRPIARRDGRQKLAVRLSPPIIAMKRHRPPYCPSLRFCDRFSLGGHPFSARPRNPSVTGLWILLAILGVPYLALNAVRLRRGRRWAFTLCQVAKEWEERERAKRLAAGRGG